MFLSSLIVSSTASSTFFTVVCLYADSDDPEFLLSSAPHGAEEAAAPDLR